MLDAQCANCPLGYGWNDPDQLDLYDGEYTAWAPMPCPVRHVQEQFNYDQIGNDDLRKVMSMLIDNTGQCLTRNLLVDL